MEKNSERAKFEFQELLKESGSDWMDLWRSAQEGIVVEDEDEEGEEEEVVQLERTRLVSRRVHRKATRDILRRGRQLGEDDDAATKEEAKLFKQVRALVRGSFFSHCVSHTSWRMKRSPASTSNQNTSTIQLTAFGANGPQTG